MRVKVKVKKKPVCNLCGKEMDFWDGQLGFGINRVLGYGSMYDGSIVNMHLCCDCTDRLINWCEVSPLVGA